MGVNYSIGFVVNSRARGRWHIENQKEKVKKLSDGEYFIKKFTTQRTARYGFNEKGVLVPMRSGPFTDKQFEVSKKEKA